MRRLASKAVVIPGPIREWVRGTFIYELCGRSDRAATLFLLRTALEGSSKRQETQKYQESKRLLQEAKL